MAELCDQSVGLPCFALQSVAVSVRKCRRGGLLSSPASPRSTSPSPIRRTSRLATRNLRASQRCSVKRATQLTCLCSRDGTIQCISSMRMPRFGVRSATICTGMLHVLSTSRNLLSAQEGRWYVRHHQIPAADIKGGFGLRGVEQVAIAARLAAC